MTFDFRKPEDLADPQTKLNRHQIDADVQRTWKNIRASRNAIFTSILIK